VKSASAAQRELVAQGKVSVIRFFLVPAVPISYIGHLGEQKMGDESETVLSAIELRGR